VQIECQVDEVPIFRECRCICNVLIVPYVWKSLRWWQRSVEHCSNQEKLGILIKKMFILSKRAYDLSMYLRD